MSSASQRGSALPKVLALVVIAGLFVAYFIWRANHGITGRVDRLGFDTRGYVAFIQGMPGGKQDILLVNPANGDEKRLTNDGASKRGLQWGPLGNQIAYAAESRAEAVTTFQIFVLGRGDPLQASYGSAAKESPVWRPDGRVIAYLSGGAIKSMTPTGEGLPQIYPPPRRGGAAGGEDSVDEEDLVLRRPPIDAFDWAPDGRSIAARQVVEGEHAIALGQANWWSAAPSGAGEPDRAMVSEPESALLIPLQRGMRPRELLSANQIGFGWFRDGTALVVAFSTRGGRSGLIVHRADDPNLPARPILLADRFTMAPENPTVSPDGKLVAFEVVRLDSAENRERIGIAVTPADAERPTIIRTPADIQNLRFIVRGAARMPRWSPTGSRLLYQAPSGSGRDVLVVNADGTGKVNLTNGRGDNFAAAWAPGS
ncbi:MAG TPA: hypothetical protein VLH79_03955 [Chthonomonadales bacterium]|nr:hypothetical protein [Chthonomonadales bacterium]